MNSKEWPPEVDRMLNDVSYRLSELLREQVYKKRTAVESAKLVEDWMQQQFSEAQLQDPRRLQVQFRGIEETDKVVPANLFTAVICCYQCGFSQAERIIEEYKPTYNAETGDLRVTLPLPVNYIDIKLKVAE